MKHYWIIGGLLVFGFILLEGIVYLTGWQRGFEAAKQILKSHGRLP